MERDKITLWSYHGMKSSTVRRSSNGEIESVSGIFKYLDSSIAPSLYRNGQVYTNRDSQGSDGGEPPIRYALKESVVRNARKLQRKKNLKDNGFELLASPLPYRNFEWTEDQIITKYYPHIQNMLKKATGASHVYAFDHNVRSAAGKKSGRKIKGGNLVQGPALISHADYTLTSSGDRVSSLM